MKKPLKKILKNSEHKKNKTYKKEIMENEEVIITPADVGSADMLFNENTQEVIAPEVEKKKKKSKKSKKVEKVEKIEKLTVSFAGLVDGNWINVQKVLQENKINYTVPGLNPEHFFLFDGKVYTAQESRNIVVKECNNLVLWV